MNFQDYRNLQEAYLDVYEQEETLDESGLSQDTIQSAVIKRQKRNDAELAKDTPEGDAAFKKGWQKVKRSKSQLNINKKRAREGPTVRIERAEGNNYDLYDIILSHLIAEGYADTQEAAEAIMVNMSEEWRESIVETRMDPRGRPASGPMNVYANPKGKPSQAHLDAVKSYDAAQKKKTPEQRKAEQDAYRERQMNNK
jgi:hypothetical protein